MIRKQANVFLLSLLVIPTVLFSADPERGIILEEDYHIVPHISARDIAIQDHILQSQPEEVQELHTTLCKPGRSCNGALFYGETGVGKTAAAYALIRKAGFRAVLFEFYDINRRRYSESPINEQNYFDVIIGDKKNIGIVIDNADLIFEKPRKETNYNTEITSSFCDWIDRYAASGRNDIFFICTATDLTYFPRPILDKLSGLMFRFEGPKTSQEKTQGFMLYVHIPVSNDFASNLDKIFRQYPHLTGRDLQKIYELAQDNSVRNQEAFSYEHVKQAIDKIMSECGEKSTSAIFTWLRKFW